MAVQTLHSKPLKHPGGQPRYFQSPEEMEQAIQAYFDDCIKKTRRPTITGLVLALGFKSRESLRDYGEYSEEYFDIITRAKLIIQEGYEQALFSKETARGAQFALSAGFGWRETQAVAVSNDVQPLTPQELRIIRKIASALNRDQSKLIDSRVVDSEQMRRIQALPSNLALKQPLEANNEASSAV